MNDFANGERYDFNNLVTYLTAPQCAGVQRQISNATIGMGVNWISTGPVNVENYAKAWPRADLESAKRIDASLAASVPVALRNSSLSSSELLPLLGQVALLSPQAGRSTLGSVIERELSSADALLATDRGRGRDSILNDLAKTLVRLGAAESSIATEIADDVEDRALSSQADSLGKILRGLALATNVDASLAPTFNLAAGALNRGVQRGKKFYLPADRSNMMAAVFSAIRVSLAASGNLEPGSADLNEALGALLNGDSLKVTALKKLWKDAIKVLSQSTNQTALADAVSLSITPEVILLTSQDMGPLLLAAKNYPQVAYSIQGNFLLAWKRIWDDLHEGHIKVAAFNDMKTRYFEPLVVDLMDLDPYLIDPLWLREVWRRGLVEDETIEKKFPRFVLFFLERRDKATKLALADNGLEPTMGAMAENMAVLWTLSNVHVPALMRWVKKYEDQEARGTTVVAGRQ
jgi:hypothetical protein